MNTSCALAIPDVVTLRAGTMKPGELWDALGITRATAHNWRRRGMPAPLVARIPTQPVAEWLTRVGGTVVRWS